MKKSQEKLKKNFTGKKPKPITPLKPAHLEDLRKKYKSPVNDPLHGETKQSY